MSRGRKALLALSSIALASAVALGGATAASADDVLAPSAEGSVSSTYGGGQSQARSDETRAAAVPVQFRARYRIANGFNKVAVEAFDPAGNPNVAVAIKHLRMVRLVNGAWKVVKTTADIDGWFATKDAASVTVPCVPGGLYRAQYTVWYKGPTVGFQTGTVTTSNWSCPR